MALIEIVYIETTNEDVIISQSSEGWSLLDINGNSDSSNKITHPVYGGSPMQLTMKGLKSKNNCFYNRFDSSIR